MAGGLVFDYLGGFDYLFPMEIRLMERVVKGIPAEDGAGVKLTRILGTPQIDHLDPFLLLDEFRSERADDYIAGFPPHPHRGFETVTYLKEGNFRHKDSRGNEGYLTAGSVQWMTAGRGIIHSEMPEMQEGLLWGYQLWINLPASLKMTEPRYHDIPAEAIPWVEVEGARLCIIAGEFRGTRGPAAGGIPVHYYDVQQSPQSLLRLPAPRDMNCICYVYRGEVSIGPQDRAREIHSDRLSILGEGDTVETRTGGNGAGFLFLAAQRIGEPIARAGPFVMNTREEIFQAFADYQNGRLDGL